MSKSTKNRNFRSRSATLTIVIAACYAILVAGLAPISFLQFQVRVANALIGLAPILGAPAIYGITIGVFLGNITSPLGPIDLLSTIPTFTGLWVIHKMKHRSVLLGLLSYSIIVSLWVTFILKIILGLPYPITFIYVLIGIALSTMGLGYSLYKTLSKTKFIKHFLGELNE